MLEVAILRASEIRKMETKEIKRRLKELKLELMKLKAQVKMHRPIQNTGRIRELRRTIARILTILREREMGEKKK